MDGKRTFIALFVKLLGLIKKNTKVVVKNHPASTNRFFQLVLSKLPLLLNDT
jgi:hypothetical protein